MISPVSDRRPGQGVGPRSAAEPRPAGSGRDGDRKHPLVGRPLPSPLLRDGGRAAQSQSGERRVYVADTAEQTAGQADVWTVVQTCRQCAAHGQAAVDRRA